MNSDGPYNTTPYITITNGSLASGFLHSVDQTNLSGFESVTSIYQATPQVEYAGGNYGTNGSIPTPYQGTAISLFQPWAKWKFDDTYGASSITGHVMLDHEPWLVSSSDATYRQNDPLKTNILAAVRTHVEMANALVWWAQKAYENGSKIGIYDYVPLVEQNALYIVNNDSSHKWKTWQTAQEKIITAKVYGGLTMVDIINGFGGNFYMTAYVIHAYTASSYLKRRFRMYIRRLLAFYRSWGLNIVPLFNPWTIGAVPPAVDEAAPLDLIQALVEDTQDAQGNEWGIWPGGNAPTTNQWNDFTTLVAGLI